MKLYKKCKYFHRFVPRCDGEEGEDVGTGSLRRQSSAFEFRSRSQKAEHGPRVEPVYENLRRDATSRASLRQAEFFGIFFCELESFGHSFAYVAHFCIFERCLDSNPEGCRSKQARYQLIQPSPQGDGQRIAYISFIIP